MINRIKWNKHPVLGDLELRFTDKDGRPFKNVVFVGENGCGKTSILESIVSLLNRRPNSHIFDVNFQINGKSETMVSLPNRYYDNGSLEKLRQLGFAYSKARSGFKTDPITYVGTSQIDKEKLVNDDNDDFTASKQLLVDLDTIDNAEWMKLTKNEKTPDFDEFLRKSRLYRFRNAFNSFFDDIKFSEVDNLQQGEKTISFIKGGTQINIDQLSTGEKQVVFRGTHLLKNSGNLDGGIVLIDEPELSMHPRWQQKIMSYYQGLFTRDGIQTVQMFFATHSEYVLDYALKQNDTLVIVLRNDNGTVRANEIRTPFFLPTITSGEINYFAYNIISVDYHIALFCYYQQKTGKSKILDVDNEILSSPFYNPVKHFKPHSYQGKNYRTLPTYVRNAIDHPDTHPPYTEEELKDSILLLQDLCK